MSRAIFEIINLGKGKYGNGATPILPENLLPLNERSSQDVEEIVNQVVDDRLSFLDDLFLDGVVSVGTITQAGNNLTFGTDWRWRLNKLEVVNVDNTVKAVPTTSTGFTRVDIFVGNSAGQITRIEGTAVALPTVAVPPTPPVGTVSLIQVSVIDTGIETITPLPVVDTFVRYDINNQNLTPTQRQNARTNIQAVSRDTNDTRTGSLTNNGQVFVNPAGNQAGLVVNATNGIIINTLEDGSSSSNAFQLQNTNGGGVFTQRRGSTRIRARGDSLTDYFILRLQNNSSTPTTVFEVAATGSPSVANRSQGSNFLTRRDELYLNYSELVTTSGTINDLALNSSTKLLILNNATDITGVIGEDTRELIIYANGVNIIVRHENVGSASANRFNIGSDYTISNGTFERFIYVDGKWRLRKLDTGGGGSVNSVTGDGVENTDPSNPIINLAAVATSNDYNDLDNLPSLNFVEGVSGLGVNNTDPQNPIIEFQEAVEREDNTVLFNKDYIIGNAGARSGNILFDFTGAKLGAVTIMYHQDASAFTFPTEAELNFDSGTDISTTKVNKFMMVLVDDTPSAEKVDVMVNWEGGTP